MGLGRGWWLGLQLRIHIGHQGTTQCSQCTNLTRSLPYGATKDPLCESCVSRAGLNAFSLRTFESLRLCPWSYPCYAMGRPRRRLTQLQTSSWWAPLLCSLWDDCSVGHWVRWCPIPVIVANILLQVRSTSLCGIAGLGPRTVTASRCFTYSPPVSSAPAWSWRLPTWRTHQPFHCPLASWVR